MKRLREVIVEGIFDVHNASRMWREHIAPAIKKHAEDMVKNNRPLYINPRDDIHPSLPNVDITIKHAPRLFHGGEYQYHPQAHDLLAPKINMTVNANNPEHPEHEGVFVHEMQHHHDITELRRRFGSGFVQKYSDRKHRKYRAYDLSPDKKGKQDPYYSNPIETRAYSRETALLARRHLKKTPDSSVQTHFGLTSGATHFLTATTKGARQKVKDHIRRALGDKNFKHDREY